MSGHVDALHLRPMTREDIPLGMRLKTAAGWNQTVADWALMLDAGAGFVGVWEGVPCGTVTLLPYGPFAWIGMLLVDPAYRGRGIGTALLEAAIDAVPAGAAARLDATPQGEPLYSRRGFRQEYGLLRLRRPAAELTVADLVDGAVTCRPIQDDDLPDLARFDAPVFGADRAGILAALQRRSPEPAWLAMRRGTVVGYCLGRSGSAYAQIGPVVASDAGVARQLLAAALNRCGGRDVVVDASEAAPAWLVVLAALGFVEQRPFTRMCLGGETTYGEPERQFAIAGPEMG